MMATPFESGWTQPSEVTQSLAPAPDDYRGWFYRVVAPRSDIAVMQSGVVVAERWFTNIVNGNPDALLRSPPATADLDMVILHGTLGGRPSVGQALRSAHGLLRRGGIVALAGYNRLNQTFRKSTQDSAVPRATFWGYRAAARHAGFTDVRIYAAHPDFDTPVAVVSICRASALRFYRFELEARAVSRGVRFQPLRRSLVELGLWPYVQACFIIVATKC